MHNRLTSPITTKTTAILSSGRLSNGPSYKWWVQ